MPLSEAGTRAKCQSLQNEYGALLKEDSKATNLRVNNQAKELKAPIKWHRPPALGPKQSKGAFGLASSTQTLTKPPLSPTSHMRAMRDTVHVHIEAKPCTESHRLFWLPSRQGAADESHEVLDAVKFGTKGRNVYGDRPTDSRHANWAVENAWALRSIQQMQRANSEPIVGIAVGAPKPAKRVNPSLISRGVTSMMVGRNNDRVKSLYEDTNSKHEGHYKPPQFGLNTSDVTLMGDAMVRQKNLMRGVALVKNST